MEIIQTRPLIYLCAPYTHDDPTVVRYRIENFCAIAAEIERAGRYHAVSALFNQLLLDRGNRLPVDSEFWKSYSLSLLGVSQRVLVIDLPGWEKSSGVRYEMEHAIELGLPVEHHPEYLLPISE